MSLWLRWQERGTLLAGQRDDAVAWASDGAFGSDMTDWGLSGGKVGSWLVGLVES